jgi:hypothetical protein
MQISVAAIRGTRGRTSFPRPSSRFRERRLGLERGAPRPPAIGPQRELGAIDLTATLRSRTPLIAVRRGPGGLVALRASHGPTWSVPAPGRRSPLRPAASPWHA